MVPFRKGISPPMNTGIKRNRFCPGLPSRFLSLLFCLAAANPLLRGTPHESLIDNSPLSTAQLSRQDDSFVEDLERRSFQYFWQEADPRTGLVPDRARM